MIFILDITSVSIADPTSSTTHYFSTDKYGTESGDTPASQQYTPALRSPEGSKQFSLTLSLGESGLTTGPAPPRDVTVHILHEVAGSNRVSAIDPTTRNLLGQAANLRGIGVGGSGDAYTLSSPFTVANGKVISHRRVGKSHDEITIRPHSDAHRITVPSGKLHGYPNGLRFDGNSAQAEITGYTAVPAEFTMGAAVLLQREWAVGASDTQTIMGTRSARLYFSKGTNEYARQLHFDYEISGPSTVTVDGPTFDADESVKFITARVDTTPASGDISVEFGIDQSFTTQGGSGGALSATAEAWKLGRFRTSTTDSADTIIGAWFLFDVLLTDTTLISYISSRLTGNEDDLVWYYPGESAAGELLDYASANASSPLDATITTATAAPLFLGTADLAGVVMPAGVGFIKNAPLTAIDPARKIYRAAFDPVGAIITVQDRQSLYTIEAVYESPLDFADNPPTVSGNVTVCPYLGGLVRVHTEVDGVENTADILGHSIFRESITLGADHGLSSVNFPNTININDDFAFDLRFGYETEGFIFTGGFISIIGSLLPNATKKRFDIRVNTNGIGTHMDYSVDLSPYESHYLTIEGWNDGVGGSASRLLINGNLVGTETDPTNVLRISTASSNLTSSVAMNAVDQLWALPMRLWDAASASDAAAVAKHRLYMFSNPAPSATDLRNQWTFYDTDRLVLPDEVGSVDGTVSSGAVWSPGVAATDRLSASKYLLDKSSTPVTFRDTAYDYDPSAISYHLAGGATTSDSSQPVGPTVAQAAASALSGGGLYLLLDPDGTATIGQVQDPATATPVATVRVEFAEGLDAADYEFQPSAIEALYAPNPTVQSSVLAGADADRKSFAERPYRSLEEPVGDNRALYGDDPAPDGRRWVLDTKFTDRSPARTEAIRVAGQWDSPRPFRRFHIIGRDSSKTDAGYTAYQPGDVLTIQHERLPGGEVNVLLLDTFKIGVADGFTGR